jgi:hypothetical protein
LPFTFLLLPYLLPSSFVTQKRVDTPVARAFQQKSQRDEKIQKR